MSINKYEFKNINPEINKADLIDVMDCLENADGIFSVIVIYDNNIGNWLVENDIAKRNAKGSYSRSKAFNEAYESLQKQYFEMLDNIKESV